MIMRRVTYSIFSLMLVCSQQSYAKGKQMEQPRKPPQEAIDACDGKQKGDEVWFIGRRGEKLQAHCEIIGNVLAAVPKGHKRKKRDDD